MKKHLFAALLSAVLLAGTLACPAQAGFPDVTDPAVNEASEVLRQLGVVNGKPGGVFDPEGTFTRAEFCKMALTVLGRAEERALYEGRVIFSDVTAEHWALGWVNAAAAVRDDVTPLVRGRGDGRFGPDDAVACGEAVTILLRCLGYTDADVGAPGGAWYAGAMARAGSVGLLDGLEGLDGGGALTRAQAALLFENLLYTTPKDSSDLFLKTALGGEVGESQLVLEVKGKALAAGGWALKTDQGSFVTLRDDLDPALQGRMCKPVTDRDGNVLALELDTEYTVRDLRIHTAEARYVRTAEGELLLVDGAVPVWRADQPKESYSEAYKEIVDGTTALFCYDKTDTLVSIYLTANSAAITAVAQEGSRPFAGAWEGTPTAVYKNGLPSSLSEVKPCDVGVYDPRTGVLELSDRKLTGVYENAAPSPASPETVTVMGCDGIQVLDCALSDLAGFQLGDPITLLLDRQGQVAGAVSPEKASSAALGLVTITKGGQDSYGQVYTAQAVTTDGLTLKGRARVSDQTAEAAPGKLWQIGQSKLGWLELSTPSSAAVTGDWDVANMTLGGAAVSPWAAVYDKIEGGTLTDVGVEAVTLDRVTADRVSFVHLDDAGVVDALVLRDVTGDGYTYGVLAHDNGYHAQSGGYSVNATTTVTNADRELTLVTNGAYEQYDGQLMGLAPGLSSVSGQRRLAWSMPLTAYENVPRAAFGDESVEVDGVDWPLADSIDSCCYNSRSETWFSSLDAALAYSATLTVYCDRDPSQGGKVRLVTAR